MAKITVSPANGAKVSLLSPEMTAWLANYQKAQLDSVCDFTEKCGPCPVEFRWADRPEALSCRLILSKDPGFARPDVFETETAKLRVEDLLPGTDYYWRVEFTGPAGSFCSETSSFSTLPGPRTVHVGGMSNVRDIGGWTGLDGRKVKFGIAYRGADLAHLTPEGAEKITKTLGIRTELDLRNEVPDAVSLFGPQVKLLSCAAPWYSWIFDEKYRGALAREIRFFTDPDLFPVYFHCSLGRDRTGTLAFLLLSLCGVSETDILKDYETSFFSGLGGYEDRTVPSEMVNVHLSAMIEGIKKIDVPEDRSCRARAPLYARTRLFLKGLGLTDSELDAVRDNLLE